MNKTIEIPIEKHFAGDYRIEYDSKYIALYGKDNRYEGFRFSNDDAIWYEEMVLIPVVIEIRKANPKIEEVTSDTIVIDLGVTQ